MPDAPLHFCGRCGASYATKGGLTRHKNYHEKMDRYSKEYSDLSDAIMQVSDKKIEKFNAQFPKGIEKFKIPGPCCHSDSVVVISLRDVSAEVFIPGHLHQSTIPRFMGYNPEGSYAADLKCQGCGALFHGIVSMRTAPPKKKGNT